MQKTFAPDHFPPIPRRVTSPAPREPAVWKVLVPLAVAALVALSLHPDGLALHAWRYFAIFAGVIVVLIVGFIVALMLQPLPAGAHRAPRRARSHGPARLDNPSSGHRPGFFPAPRTLP